MAVLSDARGLVVRFKEPLSLFKAILTLDHYPIGLRIELLGSAKHGTNTSVTLTTTLRSRGKSSTAKGLPGDLPERR